MVLLVKRRIALKRVVLEFPSGMEKNVLSPKVGSALADIGDAEFWDIKDEGEQSSVTMSR